MDNIYTMKLHDVLTYTPSDIEITRVPGGWLYRIWIDNKEEFTQPVFIPFNNEFQEVI